MFVTFAARCRAIGRFVASRAANANARNPRKKGMTRFRTPAQSGLPRLPPPGEDDCGRGELHRQAEAKCRGVAAGCLLQLAEEAGAERKTELVDRDDQTDHPGEMLLRKFLLGNQPGKRGRVSDAETEQYASGIKRRLRRPERQDRRSER